MAGVCERGFAEVFGNGCRRVVPEHLSIGRVDHNEINPPRLALATAAEGECHSRVVASLIGNASGQTFGAEGDLDPGRSAQGSMKFAGRYSTCRPNARSLLHRTDLAKA